MYKYNGVIHPINILLKKKENQGKVSINLSVQAMFLAKPISKEAKESQIVYLEDQS
jgi:hypothetical protein